MDVRIYRPAKTATQSGRARTTRWVLEYEPSGRRVVDRLMGWTSSADTSQQVHLTFPSKDDAIAFAKRNRLNYRVIEPHEPTPKRKAYADNFRYDRVR